MSYKKLALFCASIFVTSFVYAQDTSTQINNKNNPSSGQESSNNTHSANESQASPNSSSSPDPKSKKPETPQQVNAQGQDALNGTTARKDQVEQEKLKVQSEKYQAEIGKDKQSQQSNAAGAQALKNTANQSGSSNGYQSQQNAQIQASDATKNIMPRPDLMQAESNQDEAENMQAEQNKQQFYDPQANQ